MTKSFKINIVVLIGFTCFILSCNNEPAKSDDTNSNAASSTNTATNTTKKAEEVEKPQALAGNMDILIATRNSFTSLPNGTKLVFSHSFDTNGKPHLTGWVLVGNTFPGAMVATTNGAPSAVAYDNSTYFSNVVLMPSDFNKIKTALTNDNNLQFVLFLPKKVNTNFIGYDIYVSIAGAFTSTGLAATAEANPSPPRTY